MAISDWSLARSFSSTRSWLSSLAIEARSRGPPGRDLPIPHGAPVRLRVERQVGYKSMKYRRRIVVADRFEDGGKKGNIQTGWAWYTGI